MERHRSNQSGAIDHPQPSPEKRPSKKPSIAQPHSQGLGNLRFKPNLKKRAVKARFGGSRGKVKFVAIEWIEERSDPDGDPSQPPVILSPFCVITSSSPETLQQIREQRDMLPGWIIKARAIKGESNLRSRRLESRRRPRQSCTPRWRSLKTPSTGKDV